MKKLSPTFFAELYANFTAPIVAFDCGDRCAPYNENGIPFCCDPHHAIPTAFEAEWAYLRHSTDLWQTWQDQNSREMQALARQVPSGQLLVVCRGYTYCQRDFRTLACRSFPFFPYLTRQGDFLGLTYHWDYEDICWVISNLPVISPEYLVQFIRAYDALFECQPVEKDVQRQYSGMMRRVFGRRHRAIPLLHRNGFWYKVTPRNGRLRRTLPEKLPKFGDYKIAASLPFPDEQASVLQREPEDIER